VILCRETYSVNVGSILAIRSFPVLVAIAAPFISFSANGASARTADFPLLSDDLLLPHDTVLAQNLDRVPSGVEPSRIQVTPPSLERPPEVAPLPVLPPPAELIPPSNQPPSPNDVAPGDVPSTINVTGYNVQGSTVFSAAELEEATRPYVGNISFAQLLQARSAITKLYTDQGYITSGAFIPPQTLQGGIVTIQVIEGKLEEINVTGTHHLNPHYVESRLALAAQTPLNVNRLLSGLRLLQLDPLIQNLSADLEAGARAGTSVLQVQVTETNPLSATINLNNGRSPSVGTFRRGVQLTHADLLGQGDSLSVGYTNTDGSNGVDTSYTLPINPQNGTIRVSYGNTSSNVIEPPFDALDIQADSRYYELAYRQPLYRTPNEEFALGVVASRQESKTRLGIDNIGPFPLSAGADDQGRTRISAFRFFQEWTHRSSRQVLAARSQFSVGVDLLDSTINNNAPDSRFFAWRGQGQWVRLLAPDTLLFVRTDLQLTGDSLVPLEQFGLGGQDSVRGYRQDALLTDNGVLASAELRYPILRDRASDLLVQVIPFVDVGTVWNSSGPNPQNDTLASVGLGLQVRWSDRLTARVDWGIPLVDINARHRTWQESGVYFSLEFNPF